MFGLSAGELLLIAVIALVLFGNEKLPENMKKMLQGWKEARKITNNVQRSWYEVKSDIERDLHLEEEKKQIQELFQPIEIEEKAKQPILETITPVNASADAVPVSAQTNSFQHAEVK